MDNDREGNGKGRGAQREGAGDSYDPQAQLAGEDFSRRRPANEGHAALTLVRREIHWCEWIEYDPMTQSFKGTIIQRQALVPVIAIDSSKIQGEPGTGFEKADGRGPFNCGNCKYFANGTCGQSTMMERSKEPRAADGRVLVEQLDCCEYVKRKGSAKGEAFKSAHENRTGTGRGVTGNSEGAATNASRTQRGRQG